jgi:hypothetical protein
VTYARIIRVCLWLVVFLAPAVAAGYPLPYGVFALVPALAAVDGTSFRRVVLWAGLALCYAFIYRVPVGTLSLAILATSLVDVAVERGVRVDADATRLSRMGRRILRGLAWMVGMVVASALLDGLLYGAPFGLGDVASLWYRAHTGGIVVFAALVAALLLARTASRVSRVQSW